MNKLQSDIKRQLKNYIKGYNKPNRQIFDGIQNMFNNNAELFTFSERQKYGKWILEKQFELIEKGI